MCVSYIEVSFRVVGQLLLVAIFWTAHDFASCSVEPGKTYLHQQRLVVASVCARAHCAVVSAAQLCVYLHDAIACCSLQLSSTTSGWCFIVWAQEEASEWWRLQIGVFDRETIHALLACMRFQVSKRCVYVSHACLQHALFLYDTCVSCMHVWWTSSGFEDGCGWLDAMPNYN